MPSYARVIDLALELRAAAPETWEQFALAVCEVATAANREMLRCDPAQLSRAQGMALTANEFASTLVNAQRIKEKQHNG